MVKFGCLYKHLIKFLFLDFEKLQQSLIQDIYPCIFSVISVFTVKFFRNVKKSTTFTRSILSLGKFREFIGSFLLFNLLSVIPITLTFGFRSFRRVVSSSVL